VHVAIATIFDQSEHKHAYATMSICTAMGQLLGPLVGTLLLWSFTKRVAFYVAASTGLLISISAVIFVMRPYYRYEKTATEKVGSFCMWCSKMRELVSAKHFAVQSISLVTAAVEFFVQSISMVYMIKLQEEFSPTSAPTPSPYSGNSDWVDSPGDETMDVVNDASHYLMGSIFLLCLYLPFVGTMQLLRCFAAPHYFCILQIGFLFTINALLFMGSTSLSLGISSLIVGAAFLGPGLACLEYAQLSLLVEFSPQSMYGATFATRVFVRVCGGMIGGVGCSFVAHFSEYWTAHIVMGLAVIAIWLEFSLVALVSPSLAKVCNANGVKRGNLALVHDLENETY